MNVSPFTRIFSGVPTLTVVFPGGGCSKLSKKKTKALRSKG